MHKCQHNKTIVSFCLSQHCQSKQSGGCQDCIKKYHNHIGQVAYLYQNDVKNIVKKFQIQHNYRPKSKSLQQSIFNFFTYIKNNISSNLDIVCKNLINQIGYPYLHKNNNLNCYKRLKNKEYRKVVQKQLKDLYDLYKNSDIDQIIKQEKNIYNQAVNKMEQTLELMEKNVKEIFDNLISMGKNNVTPYDRTYYVKINQTFKQIKKYPDISFPKSEPYKQKIQQKPKPGPQPQLKRKLTRDVSLDKHVKIQSKLKYQSTRKTPQQISSPTKKTESKQKFDRFSTNRQKQQASQKQKSNRPHKGSFELKAEQISLKSPINTKMQNYSEKQEQIIQRKKKLMQLMNSKPQKKEQNQPKKYQKQVSKPQLTSYLRTKTQNTKIQVGDQLKETPIPEKFLLNAQFLSNQNKIYSSPNKYQQFNRFKGFTTEIKLSSKRAKTAYQSEQQVSDSKKDTRNQTVMSSQTQTQPLFNAKIHNPLQDLKPQDDFQIKQQSRHKCIVVPQVNMQEQQVNQTNQCRSPLLKKKKQIQNFSALMKLAESKIIQQYHFDSSKSGIKQVEQQKSFIKINRILQQDPKTKGSKQLSTNYKSLGDQKSLQSHQSVEINQNQQKSLALLLHSLKLPASQAIVQLQKSLAYSSNNLSAAQYLSYLYLQADRPQDCLKLCNDVLKNISSSQSNQLALRLNINKSASLNHLGRYSECITFLQRCLRYRHNDILYKNLADAYYSIGILQKAIYNYEHSILQNSSNTEAHYNLAVCHYQQQNYHNASIYIDKALKHQSTNQVYKQMQKYIEQKIFANNIK